MAKFTALPSLIKLTVVIPVIRVNFKDFFSTNISSKHFCWSFRGRVCEIFLQLYQKSKKSKLILRFREWNDRFKMTVLVNRNRTFSRGYNMLYVIIGTKFPMVSIYGTMRILALPVYSKIKKKRFLFRCLSTVWFCLPSLYFKMIAFGIFNLMVS